LKPFELLLLDEVTVDVDVLGELIFPWHFQKFAFTKILARRNLMAFLKQETEGPRKATVLYATHVFDSLGDWPTHIIHIANHRVRICEELNKNAEYLAMLESWNPRKGSPLSELVEMWLQREYDERKLLKVKEVTETVEEKLAKDKSTADRFYNYWN
jgi:CCR4-NOT complex subunit CAF16